MIVAGVDVGGHKAAVVVLDDGSLVAAQAFCSQAERRQDQLYEVADFVDRMVTAVDADVIYIEEPLVGRGVRSSLQVAQCAGAIMSVLSVDAYFVPVGTWKKAVIGSGNATKEAVSFWLQQTHPGYSELCEEDQDLADATCIALYGLGVQNLAESLSELLTD